MRTDTITVVTPSFNQGEVIEETVKSVISQEGGFYLEYIIMDGGSTDRSVEVIKKYDSLIREKRWPVRCRGIDYRWVSQKDAGQSDALGKGFKGSSGAVLAWLNSDDVYRAGALEKVWRFLDRNPGMVGVYGDAELIDESGAPAGRCGVQPFDRWKLIHSRNFIEQASCFFRREAFEACGGIDQDLYYVMDWDLWIRLSMTGDLAYIPETLSSRRLYAANKSQRGGGARLSEIRRMLRRYGATGRSPVMLNYLYETLWTEARWGWGGLGVLAKLIFLPVVAPLAPFFLFRYRRALGSCPNGDFPPKGAFVIPPPAGPEKQTLVLRLSSVCESVCRIRLRLNHKDLGNVNLEPGRNVELKTREAALDRFNLLEARASRSESRYEEGLGRSVRVSANLQWAWE